MALKKFSIVVLHGPNLNLLGQREPHIYGSATLEDINNQLHKVAHNLNCELVCLQSNHEGQIVDWIQEHNKKDGILINPAALTHTSVALRDALIATNKPTVEVHLSNIFAREEFRKSSLISDIAKGVITGFGQNSYILGLTALVEHLKST